MRRVALLITTALIGCVPRHGIRPERPILTSRPCDRRFWPTRIIPVYISETFPTGIFGPRDVWVQDILDSWYHPDASVRMIYRGRKTLRTPYNGNCRVGIPGAIYLFWAAAAWQDDSAGRPYLAKAAQCYEQHRITQSVVAVNAHDNRFAPLTRRPRAMFDEYDLRLVLVHELGHALGFAHCEHDTTHPKSVMAPTFFPGEVYQGLDPVDVARLKAKYPK